MITKVEACAAALMWAMMLTAAGCGKSDSDAAAKPGGAGGGIEQEAQSAAFAEIQKHWTKGPDGWTTSRISGSPYAPDHYVRQVRDFSVQEVQSFDLSDSDRLNGLEWEGQVNFKSAPCREAGDPGLVLEGIVSLSINRQRGKWTQWVDFQPDPIRLHKMKGQWQAMQDTWLLRGSMPTADDYAKAGVK